MKVTRYADSSGPTVRPDARTSRSPRRISRAAAITLVGLAALSLGACSSRSTDTATGAAPASASRGASSDGYNSNGVPAAKSSSNEATGAVAAPSVNGQAASFNTNALEQPKSEGTPDPQAGRSVISTATLEVKVDNVASAKEAAALAAERNGGFLFGEQTTFGARSRSVLTLKVPPANFRKVLSELAALGALSAEEVKTDDVTQQVIDLDARISAASDSLDRTRALLAASKSVTEISQLENEVVRRQTDLESLRGQQKSLKAKVDLSTVVVTLAGDKDSTAAIEQKRQEEERKRQEEEKKKNEAKPLPGFFDGLNGGMGVAASVGSVALAAVGALIPFLPLFILAYVAFRLARRGRKKVTPEAKPSPA